MNHRLACERNSYLFVATTFGLTLLTAPALTLAQAPNPLDANASVTSTTYKSPLADFRAFDPDEAMQSWVEANRRVDEIGGWRTYLRQANPPKKSANEAPANAEVQPIESEPTVREKQAARKAVERAAIKTTEQTKPVIRVQPDSTQVPISSKQPEPRMAPRQNVAAVTSNRKGELPATLVSGVPTLAEGSEDQQDEMQLTQPNLPSRFSRGECPRILTGLRIPVNPRSVALSKETERLLLRVTKCFEGRSYIVGGHTDGRGPLAANLTLSQSRADAVRTFLVANGVSAERITSRGYGETRPIDTNRTKRGRARNRRIDFTLDK